MWSIGSEEKKTNAGAIDRCSRIHSRCSPPPLFGSRGLARGRPRFLGTGSAADDDAASLVDNPSESLPIKATDSCFQHTFIQIESI